MRLSSILSASTAALVLGAGSAMAGGVIAPVIEAAPVAVTPVAPVAGAWQGAYVGGALGYSFRGDDEVGLQAFGEDGPAGRATGITDVKVSGVTGSVHAGYRWQRGQWVFGPNLSAEFGSVSDTSTGSFSLNGIDYETTVESDVRSVIDLTMKTGYLIDPTTMIYGVAGVSRGNFNYSFDTTGTSATTAISASSSEDYSVTGYVLGLGFERAFTERMSGFGELNYRNYGSTDIDTPLGINDGTTRATPSHSNIKLGVNFRF